MHIFPIVSSDYDSNIYIVTGKFPTIIDTGTGFHSKEILCAIQEVIEPGKIIQIILTHEHFDHVGGALDIFNATQGNAKIFAHRNAVKKLKEGKSTFAEMLGGTMPKIHVHHPLSGGEHLMVGDESAEVLATPGHSEACLCILGPHSRVLFSGDTVFADGGFGRYDFPGGNLQSLVTSIEQLATLKIDRLYPGHGPFIEKNGNVHVAEALQNVRSLM